MAGDLSPAALAAKKHFKWMERRADFLAEKFGLSPQLTLVWVSRNPLKALRPMGRANLNELRRWAHL